MYIGNMFNPKIPLIPCAATLHEQDGSHTMGVQRHIVDDIYVFAVYKHDWCKMVTVDKSGEFVDCRYMSKDSALTIENWKTANVNDDAYYVTDLTFCPE